MQKISDELGKDLRDQKRRNRELVEKQETLKKRQKEGERKARSLRRRIKEEEALYRNTNEEHEKRSRSRGRLELRLARLQYSHDEIIDRLTKKTAELNIKCEELKTQHAQAASQARSLRESEIQADSAESTNRKLREQIAQTMFQNPRQGAPGQAPNASDKQGPEISPALVDPSRSSMQLWMRKQSAEIEEPRQGRCAEAALQPSRDDSECFSVVPVLPESCRPVVEKADCDELPSEASEAAVCVVESAEGRITGNRTNEIDKKEEDAHSGENRNGEEDDDASSSIPGFVPLSPLDWGGDESDPGARGHEEETASPATSSYDPFEN